MTKTEEWIAAQIADCSVRGARGRAGVDDLVRALFFFDRNGSQIFGMSANRDAMPALDSLRSACASALRGWFDELGRGDVGGQVELFEAVARHRLAIELPVPAPVAAKRALEQERDTALARYGRPSAALPAVPALAAGLERVRALATRVSLRSVRAYVRLPRPLDMAQFEWLPDEWSAVASAALDPAFFPIAGADGDYLGLLLDSVLCLSGRVPLVYYFHEDDPPYTWVFESCATAADVLQAVEAKKSPSSVSPGTEHELVTQVLDGRARFEVLPAMGDGEAEYERTGQAFAARSVAVQRIWREASAKLAALRA